MWKSEQTEAKRDSVKTNTMDGLHFVGHQFSSTHEMVIF